MLDTDLKKKLTLLLIPEVLDNDAVIQIHERP